MARLRVFTRWSKDWNGGPAGLVCIAWGGPSGERIGLHLAVRRRSRLWGFKPLSPFGDAVFGAGPLFLLAWGGEP